MSLFENSLRKWPNSQKDSCPLPKLEGIVIGGSGIINVIRYKLLKWYKLLYQILVMQDTFADRARTRPKGRTKRAR